MRWGPFWPRLTITEFFCEGRFLVGPAFRHWCVVERLYRWLRHHHWRFGQGGQQRGVGGHDPVLSFPVQPAVVDQLWSAYPWQAVHADQSEKDLVFPSAFRVFRYLFLVSVGAYDAAGPGDSFISEFGHFCNAALSAVAG